MDFIDHLRMGSRLVVLWLKEASGTAPQCLLGEPWKVAGSAGLFEVPQAASTKVLLDSLYEGGWELLFFARPIETLDVPEFIVDEPEQLLETLRSAKADAIVVSWLDDIEWLIAFPV